jgi:nucleotide-binding universal stress UspA family protein
MIKTILVPLAGTAADQPVLTQAASFARPFRAHLECVHVRPDKGYLLNLAATNALGVGVEPNVGEILDELEKGARERADSALKTFEKFFQGDDVQFANSPPTTGMSASFTERSGDQIEVLIHELRGHDLGIVPGGGVKGGLRAAEAAQLLAAGGRPLVLTPSEYKRTEFDTVVIAWKPTPEASRALSAAIELIKQASNVVIATAAEGGYDAGKDATDNILSYLNWHGVNATVREVLPAGRAASEAVLEAAKEMRADLLVMGAYGRGRLSEIIFGGFTQQVLGRTDLPVFLLH